MAEEWSGEAELGMLKNSTTFLPPTHSLLLPWLHTGEHLRIGVSPYHYCWCWQSAGSQSLLVFLYALELSQSISFSLLEALSIILWTYWSSVIHRLITGFVVFLPAGLSVSLFLYWSPCPHSWYQSHFLQEHFKGIQPGVSVSLAGK